MRRHNSDGLIPSVSGADADGFLHRNDEDLAVAAPASMRRLSDGFDHGTALPIRADDLDLDLRGELHDRLTGVMGIRFVFLPAGPPGARSPETPGC